MAAGFLYKLLQFEGRTEMEAIHCLAVFDPGTKTFKLSTDISQVFKGRYKVTTLKERSLLAVMIYLSKKWKQNADENLKPKGTPPHI